MDKDFDFQRQYQTNNQGIKGVTLPQYLLKANSVNIKFRVSCPFTQVGETVKVTGSCQELGNWDPQKGLQLITNPSEFPQWKGTTHVDINNLTKQSTLEYKYVITKEDIDHIRKWEPLAGNRVIDIQKVKEVNIEDVYGRPNHIREELVQCQFLNQEAGQGKSEELSSEHSQKSPDQNAKVIKKVREVNNVVEKYQQLKKKGGSSNIKQTPQQYRYLQENAPSFSNQGIMSTPTEELMEFKRQLSIENTFNVDEEQKLIRSIEDIELTRRESLRKTREMIYNLKESEDTDFPSSTNQVAQGMRYFKSPELGDQLTRRFTIVGGTTGGVISSGEDEEEEQEEEDDLVEEEKKLLEDIKISADDIVIVASFKLPISVARDTANGGWKIKPSKSLLYPTMFNLRERKKMVKIIWIGWPGVEPENDKEAQEITELLKDFGCVPVFFDSETLEQFLYFHETVLRPLFHNFKGLNDFEYDLGKQEYWHKYQQVNTKFASVITELKQEKEMIWIHDNYLLLVPTYVRRRDLNANIGFFMHCPFPSSDIYKMFPYRGEVLKSLLLCDLIGFHLFEYARNFYTACRRILGLNHEFKKGGFLGIECFGRNVMLRISHIGIQEEDILESMEKEEYTQFVKHLQQLTAKKRHIISSIDRFHPISGIKNKLLAFQKFLRDFPPFRQTTCLVQYVVASECTKCQQRECSHFSNGNSRFSINQTRSEILALVDQIEKEFGKNCIQYLEQDLTMEQRMALWTISNILLITTLRDGQCLPPLEFITVKKYIQKSNKSAVILSEFSGCNRALGGVLKVNPFNVDEIAKNIDIAINMPQEEKEQRFKIAYNYISKHSTYKWAEAFLKDLKRSHQPCENVSKYMILGLGLNQTLIKTRQGFQELKLNFVEQNYQRSINRLIIIDQEGVLPMKGQQNNKATVQPYSQVLQILNDITKDERNTVFVISSQTKDLMHKWYAESCPNLGLAAENGFFWRLDSMNKNEHQWIKLLKVIDFCWIESVKDIMQSYTEKTDGAYIEEKESMIVWNYKDTDPEFGNWQAKELTSHLEHVFCNLPIEIVHNKKCLEVIPNQLKKIKLVKLLMEQLAKKFPLDFVLYIGDDCGNEPVFTYLNNKKQQNSKMLSGVNIDIFKFFFQSVYTCTIGRKATQAKYFLNDSDAIVHLLETLQNISLKARKNKSFNELRSMAAYSGQQLNHLRNNSGTIFDSKALEPFNRKSQPAQKHSGNNHLNYKEIGGKLDMDLSENEDDELFLNSGNSSCNEAFNSNEKDRYFIGKK